MPVKYLELENFRSYGGKQRIGPFTEFTSGIGPNGSGKSNLMDAISFVLGVRSRDSRSHQIRDLIHRGVSATDDTDAATMSQQQSLPCRATLVYQKDDCDKNRDDEEEEDKDDDSDDKAKEIVFSRHIRPAGVGSYHVNGKTVSYKQYEEHLSRIGVLVQACNFLVFKATWKPWRTSHQWNLCN